MLRGIWEMFDTIENAGYACYCLFDEEVKRASACVMRHARRLHAHWWNFKMGGHRKAANGS